MSSYKESSGDSPSNQESNSVKCHEMLSHNQRCTTQTGFERDGGHNRDGTSEKGKYLRGRNRTVTDTFSFARFKNSSLEEVGVRGLPTETEEAELSRNFCGGVMLGGVGMLLFLPLPGVKATPIDL